MSQSHLIGRAFEEVVEVSLREYERDGQASIFRMGTRARFAKIKGRTRVIAERSMPDYVGCVAPDGRLIAFDAKTTNNQTRWTLGREKHHQLETLARLRSMGAIAFFMVEARQYGCLYCHPVPPKEAIPNNQLMGLATLDVTTIKFNRVETAAIQVEGSKLGTYPWLDPLLRQWPDDDEG